MITIQPAASDPSVAVWRDDQAPSLSPPSLDIEAAITWALAQSGTLPWSIARDHELAFDGGLTARPKRRQSGNWALAEACAGLKLGSGRPLLVRRRPSSDAVLIIEAIKDLPARQAVLVLACGRLGTRPDWMPGVVPRRVTRKRSHKRGRHRRIQVWVPCDPSAIRAAREAYSLWHAALSALVRALDDRLSGFRIKGLGAAPKPWEGSPENSA